MQCSYMLHVCRACVARAERRRRRINPVLSQNGTSDGPVRARVQSLRQRLRVGKLVINY